MPWWVARLDGWLLLCGAALSAIGLTLVSSAATPAEFQRQSVAMAVGWGLVFGLAAIDYEVYARKAPWLYGLGLLLLGLVLLLGEASHGARRWLLLPGLRFQPSEPVKLAVIVTLAAWLGRDQSAARKVLGAGVIVLPAALLIALEPDLGTAASLAAVAAAMLYLAQVNGWLLAALGLAAAAPLPLVLHDYQRDRLLVFLDPERDPTGSGWNLLQSKIAVGSGQLWGQGLYHGSQKALDFLPERHTDFIFAVAGEELGFIGCLPILALFATLCLAALNHCGQARDDFGRLLLGGLASYFAVHVVINVGMVLGVTPVTGLPLPFFSFGGSALVTNLAALGLMMSVICRRRYQARQSQKQLDERFAHLRSTH